jgi:hypothetical protein
MTEVRSGSVPQRTCTPSSTYRCVELYKDTNRLTALSSHCINIGTCEVADCQVQASSLKVCPKHDADLDGWYVTVMAD